jgi:predicted O-methyltransferase YrrM
MKTLEYEFTVDWSRAAIRNWQQHLAEFGGQKLCYLEIGAFEGRSGCWMLDNVLTHPQSRYIGIDNWSTDLQQDLAERVEDRCRRNLARHGSKVELIRGDSLWVLREPRWLSGSVDLGYIDGNHQAYPCLVDSVLLWPLISQGGMLMWDDYGSHRRRKTVRRAVDSFLSCIEGQFEVVFSNRQLGVRKLSRQ